MSALVLLALAVGVPPLASSLAASSADEPTTVLRSQEAMPIRVAPAVLTDSYEVERLFTGALVAERRSRLSFERPGKIVALQVDEGDRVEPGAELAVLDRRRIEARRLTVAAELAEAKAVLAELEFGPRLETIATADAELQSLVAQARLAERNLVRRRDLVDTAAISREEYEESFYALRVAEARATASEKTLEELKAGTRKERVDAQAARVQALNARLADVDHELEDTRLVAPYAGAIARRHRDEGAIVAAGEAVFDLIEDTRLEAWIGLPASAASRLVVGDEVELRINGRRRRAVVKSLRSELDPGTRTRNAVFSVATTTADQIVAGQVARVALTEAVRQPGYWVPASALTPGERGLWAVYVVEDGSAEGGGGAQKVARRDVELIHTEGGRSYVRGTLQPGEQVVVAGGHKIVAGQRVEVVTDAS
ncbi:MAG: efflux RND transporter periplasmic adaptor subunit [Planctomycetota bacterium]